MVTGFLDWLVKLVKNFRNLKLIIQREPKLLSQMIRIRLLPYKQKWANIFSNIKLVFNSEHGVCWSTNWAQYESNWTKVIQIEPKWSKNWSKVSPTCKTKVSQTKPKWVKLIQSESNWSKVSPTKPKWAKVSQTQPKWIKLNTGTFELPKHILDWCAKTYIKASITRSLFCLLGI